MRCALSIYNLPTGHSFLILLKYSNPPEMKINKGTRNECEFMKMNTLEKIYNCLRNESPSVDVDPAVAEQAVKSIHRMLELS